jgi:hypothetical protein
VISGSDCAAAGGNKGGVEDRRIDKVWSKIDSLDDPMIAATVHFYGFWFFSVNTRGTTYDEQDKPVALDRESGLLLLDEAKRRDLRLACAPDTILGSGLQTGLRAIADGQPRLPPGGPAFNASPRGRNTLRAGCLRRSSAMKATGATSHTGILSSSGS